MTRRAKERRMERVAEKQRALDELLARERRLSARPEWRQLLRAIDGPPPPAGDRRSAAEEAAPKDPRRGRAASASIAHDLQWKSSNVPVAAAGSFQLPVKLDAPKGVLRYAFSTRDYDVNFGVQMMCADGSMVEVLELRRYESQKRPVEGSFELAGPGMLLLLWDNSFSWVNPKQLSYMVELHQDAPPETPTEKAELALSERVERQRRILRAQASAAAVDATIASQALAVEELRRQIKALEEKLDKTEAAKLAATKARSRLDDEVDTLAWEINALNWRCLGEAALSLIVSNLDSRSFTAWSLTSKQWSQRLSTHRPRLLAPSSDNQRDDDRRSENPAQD